MLGGLRLVSVEDLGDEVSKSRVWDPARCTTPSLTENPKRSLPSSSSEDRGSDSIFGLTGGQTNPALGLLEV